MAKISELTNTKLQQHLRATIKTVGPDAQSVRILRREIDRRTVKKRKVAIEAEQLKAAIQQLMDAAKVAVEAEQRLCDAGDSEKQEKGEVPTREDYKILAEIWADTLKKVYAWAQALEQENAKLRAK